MPYTQDSKPQSQSSLIGVKDVFHSDTVFINNVSASLWLIAGASPAFAGAKVNPTAPTFTTQYQEAALAVTEAYVASPSSFYNAAAEQAGVKKYYPGTVDDTGTTHATLLGSTTTSETSDIKLYLDNILEEASRGLWRETGQGGKPSNKNIVGESTSTIANSLIPEKTTQAMAQQGIWPQLGFNMNQRVWQTDQTAWCAGFVNFVLKMTGHKYVATASAKAIHTDYTKWGATPVIDRSTAQPGDIVVWTFSHVNFVYENKNGKLSFCGGNQTPTSGKNNNPADGDVTISYKNGCSPTHPDILSIWRPALAT